MSGMCRSDAVQNSKNRLKFQAQENSRTWETHKVRAAKRQANRIAKRHLKIEARALVGKPLRGTARNKRRRTDKAA